MSREEQIRDEMVNEAGTLYDYITYDLFPAGEEKPEQYKVAFEAIVAIRAGEGDRVVHMFINQIVPAEVQSFTAWEVAEDLGLDRYGYWF